MNIIIERETLRIIEGLDNRGSDKRGSTVLIFTDPKWVELGVISQIARESLFASMMVDKGTCTLLDSGP